MTDARIVNLSTIQAPSLDLLLKPIGTLDETQELATSVYIALGTDRLAEPADDLPELLGPLGIPDRRGWWGDLDADDLFHGWPIGTRVWLLHRGKIAPIEARIGSTTARAEMYTYEALQPFLDQGVCSRLEVTATRTGIETITVNVVMYRGPLPAIALQFQSLWQEIVELPVGDPYGYPANVNPARR